MDSYMILTWLNRFLDPQRAAEATEFLFVFFLIIILVLAGLLVYLLIRGKRLRRELSHTFDEVYYHLLPTLSLDRNDHEIIKSMAMFLPYSQQRYRILLDPQAFDDCAGQLIRRGQADEPELKKLRDKLGFLDLRKDIIPASTADIAPGMPLLIRPKGAPAIRGEISGSTPEALLINARQKTASVLKSVPVTVYFQNRAGFFSFVSTVETKDEHTLALRHSETIKRYQRRRDSRKRMRLPIFVRLDRSDKKPMESTLVDLSAGGARLSNPLKMFKAPDRIWLSFASDVNSFSVAAHVVWTSKNGETIHVQFESVNDSLRQRIVDLLSRAPGQQRE